MKSFHFLLTVAAIFNLNNLAAEPLEDNKGAQAEQPKYIISMKVEEVSTDGTGNKVIASPVFECVSGKTAKVSMNSSNFDQSNPKSIEIEARINSHD